MIIDTDTHAVEEPGLWTDRMASKWGDAIPHVKYVAEQQSDVWFVGDMAVQPVGFSVIARGAAGEIHRREEFPAFITVFDEMHPSCWDPDERVKVMDQFGVHSAVLYPNLGLIGPDVYRMLPDMSIAYQVEIASAYNDWILDWEKRQPGRFIPVACIPYWDVPSSVREVERCAQMGHRAFVMSGAPQWHGEPYLADRHWDPLWAAVQATGLPISFHAGGGNQGIGSIRERSANEGRNPVMVNITVTEFLRNGMITTDLLMSGVLPRFPGLRFIAVESGIGWIPFVLESLDWHARRYELDRDRPEFKELPSYYFHRQVFSNTWYEQLTDFHVDRIGEDNILFETDYPHPTCLIEDEVSQAVGTLDQLRDPAVREKILWKNATQLFGLTVEAADGGAR
jgi:predicted TIM-barrel fold metal-dependent hydrolase